jgi:hypothetical protein
MPSSKINTLLILSKSKKSISLIVKKLDSSFSLINL